MKLLFDQNLSFKLCRRLEDLYPGSTQARLAGLDEADDRELWQHALDNGTRSSLKTPTLQTSHSLSVRPRKSSGCAAATLPRPRSKNFYDFMKR